MKYEMQYRLSFSLRQHFTHCILKSMSVCGGTKIVKKNIENRNMIFHKGSFINFVTLLRGMGCSILLPQGIDAFKAGMRVGFRNSSK